MQVQATPRKFRLVKTLSTFGLTESAVNEQLSEFKHIFREIGLGIRVSFPIIHLELYTRSQSDHQLPEHLIDATRWLADRLGDQLFSEEGKSMEEVVGSLLRNCNATLALAESCTGGLISNLITNLAGSSDYFLLSAVTYSNTAKVNVLDVSASTLEQFGAVDIATAKEMARNVKKIAGATYGLSTSGIAGPSGGTKDKPVGTVCIGVATPNSVVGHRFHYADNNRSRNKRIFAITALDLMRRELSGIR
ncbi:MAG: nicotinamide-nucleotide amidohydrolase family protein [Desulfobacterales bacterium]|jgi:nicotinamide-nucleotide amidase